MSDAYEPMKRISKLTVAEQVRVMVQSGGYFLEPRVLDEFPKNPGSSVSPSSPRTPASTSDTPDSGTSAGRGNDPQRSGGRNIPPVTVGLEVPNSGQVGGSNSSQSGIKQLPSATLQQPLGQISVSEEPDSQRFIITISKTGDARIEKSVEHNLAPPAESLKSDARDSDLVQPVPPGHLSAGTRLQRSREGV